MRPTLTLLLRPLGVLTGAAVLAVLTAMPASAAPLPLGIEFNFFGGGTGVGQILKEIQVMAEGYEDRFQDWGELLYVIFFGVQFILMGATMLIKGPFAIATYRPIHALNPFANLFFFLVSGTLGFLFVANASSATLLPSGDVAFGGWVNWLYELFGEMGQKTACQDQNIAFGIGDPCDEGAMSWIGMRLSGVLLVLADSGGTSDANPITWISGAAGASTAAFAAFTLIAIQLVLTKAAFALAIVAAPLFLATIIFQPMSGIATGYISFVAYLGVRLFILQLVAGLASIVANAWLNSILMSTLASVLSGQIGGMLGGGSLGGVDAGQLFGFNASVIAASLLFVSLTVYFPTKIAGMVSQRLNLDINAILFRGELPVAIS